MSVTASRGSVTATPMVLSATVEGDLSPGQYLLVVNRGAASVDLGPSTVTTGMGFELAPGDFVGIDLEAGEQLYAVAASGTVVVGVLRAGV